MAKTKPMRPRLRPPAAPPVEPEPVEEHDEPRFARVIAVPVTSRRRRNRQRATKGVSIAR